MLLWKNKIQVGFVIFFSKNKIKKKMFVIWNLHEYACRKFNMYYAICDRFKKDIGVWRVPFKISMVKLMASFYEKFSATDYYVTLYWITLVLAAIGLYESCYEFVRVFTDESYEPSTFGNRSYEYFSLHFRRRARICGLTLSIKLFICMLYGMMTFKTSYILPFLVVYGVIIPLEVFYWLCDSSANWRFKFKPMGSLAFLVIRWCFVLQIVMVIDQNK
jgi:hypothetical protein